MSISRYVCLWEGWRDGVEGHWRGIKSHELIERMLHFHWHRCLNHRPPIKVRYRPAIGTFVQIVICLVMIGKFMH